MTHVSVPPDVLDHMGIGDDVIRVSVGIEDIEDLLADLKQAFNTSVSSEFAYCGHYNGS
jgi:cystathionine beta-lyase/cystathionine gamma-synthase